MGRKRQEEEEKMKGDETRGGEIEGELRGGRQKGLHAGIL